MTAARPSAAVGQLLQSGLAHHQAGRLAEAEAAYRQVLALAPAQPDALHLMGVAAYQGGRLDEAVALYRRALAGQPDYPAALNNFATALKDQGALDAARRAAEKALRLAPDFADGHNTLGNIRLAQGDTAAAAAAFRRSVALRPDNAAVIANLANALVALGDEAEAEACYRRAVALAPGYAVAWLGLGDILRAQTRHGDAADAYRLAAAADPANPVAHNNLGAALQDIGRNDEAAAAYRAAAAADPAMALAHENLAGVLREQGRCDDALAALDRAIALAPDNDALRVKRALMVPVMMESAAAIAATRARVEAGVDALLAGDVAVASPETEINRSVFYLVYHGHDDRPLQEKIARLFLKACPSLAFTAPHCAAPRPAAGRRLKVGILSYHLYSHTIGNLNLGLVEALPRDRLEVVVLRPPGTEDPVSQAIDAAADRVVRLPAGFADMRARIAAEELDVLYYLDIGMDVMTYYLAFARLAPVQCVWWGHPVTNGIPTLDYYLASQDLEPADGQAQYTERLIRFRNLSICYRPPTWSGRRYPPARFGLPDDATLYACPQMPFKFHPDFDPAIAGILRGDPSARVVLVAGGDPNWAAILRARLARAMPDVAGRVVFLDPLPRDAYIGLLNISAVALDTFPFGGGNSSYDAFVAGTPVVCRPGPNLRGRITYALYRQMGIDDCLARDPAHYVEIALRLGRDPAERARVAGLIADRRSRLEGTAAAADLERFLVAAVDAAARGERLAGPPGE